MLKEVNNFRLPQFSRKVELPAFRNLLGRQFLENRVSDFSNAGYLLGASLISSIDRLVARFVVEGVR